MKQLLTILAILVLWSSLFAQTAIQPAGSGTVGDPYQIANLNNLYWVTQDTSSWSSCFLQTADIDASSDTSWNSDTGFSPIGKINTPFKGYYDGNGHIISGIYINNYSIYVGFFGFTQDARIKNLGITNIYINGASYIGALVGDSYANDSISNCFATGTISTDTYSGSGGLIGVFGVGGASILSNSYSTVNISGYQYLGGLIGKVISGTVVDCYSIGEVNAYLNNGGLIASNNGSVINCFFDNQTSYIQNSAGGNGESTTAMQTQSTYSGWDFTNTWIVKPDVNNGFPQLRIFRSLIVLDISGNTGTPGTVLSYMDTTAKADTADSSGNYSLKVSYNWTGSIKPSKIGYRIIPYSISYNNLLNDTTNQNYSAAPITYVVKGNAGIGNAVLIYNDTTNKFVTSDSAGNYTIIVSYNWSGTIKPSKPGYVFAPDSISYNNLSTDTTNQNYITEPIIFTISGNAGVGGTVLSYKDGTDKTDTADASGNYSFMVSYDWNGVVVPSKSNYTFTPSSISYSNLHTDSTNQNYDAQIVSAVADIQSGIPKEYNLYQNYPNPFNPSTVIRFALPKESDVKISIYNVLGQEVKTLFNGNLDAGFHQVEFYADNLSSGIYIYWIQANNYSSIKKMMLLK